MIDTSCPTGHTHGLRHGEYRKAEIVLEYNCGGSLDEETPMLPIMNNVVDA